LSQIEAYLSAAQLGITVVGLALGRFGEPYLAALLTVGAEKLGIHQPVIVNVVSFSAITAVLIVVGELAPKVVAIRKPLESFLAICRPFEFFYVLFKPAILLFNGTSAFFVRKAFRIEPVSEHELAHSEEELRAILSASAKGKAITELGTEILLNALDMKELVVRDIMTPRGEVTSLDLDDTFEDNLKRALASNHTRFPLCKGFLDETVGLVHVKDVLRLMHEGKNDLSSIRREIHAVPEMMSLEKLLSFFLQKHAHLALVVDEFGGAVGIVTLDNVLAELVGEIQDEFDADVPELRKLNDDEYAVAGSLGLYELNDHLGLEWESEEVSTVAGFVTHRLGHLPTAGEKMVIMPFEVTVIKADARRVHELHLKRIAHEDAEQSH
jgi:CBS domain containing-hemolysin-like protein